MAVIVSPGPQTEVLTISHAYTRTAGCEVETSSMNVNGPISGHHSLTPHRTKLRTS